MRVHAATSLARRHGLGPQACLGQLGLLIWLAAVSAQAEPSARFADEPAVLKPASGAAPAATAPAQAARRASEPGTGFVRNLATSHLERGNEREARGDLALALAEYSRAIAIDSSFGAAYLRLGALRERLGDPREAELVYSAAAGLNGARAQALLARAALRRRAARTREALVDLEQSVELEPSHDALASLGTLYIELQAWPAALAVHRRLLSLAQQAGDAHGKDELRLQVRALRVLAGDSDVAREHGAPHDWVRFALSSIARR